MTSLCCLYILSQSSWIKDALSNRQYLILPFTTSRLQHTRCTSLSPWSSLPSSRPFLRASWEFNITPTVAARTPWRHSSRNMTIPATTFHGPTPTAWTSIGALSEKKNANASFSPEGTVRGLWRRSAPEGTTARQTGARGSRLWNAPSAPRFNPSKHNYEYWLGEGTNGAWEYQLWIVLACCRCITSCTP